MRHGDSLRIAVRLQQERSALAKAIKEIVVDPQAETLAKQRHDRRSLLFLYAPSKQHANRIVQLLADYPHGSLDYFGEHSVEVIERDVGPTPTGQGNDR